MLLQNEYITPCEREVMIAIVIPIHQHRKISQSCYVNTYPENSTHPISCDKNRSHNRTMWTTLYGVFTLADTDIDTHTNTDTDKMGLQVNCICIGVGVCVIVGPCELVLKQTKEDGRQMCLGFSREDNCM